MLPDETPTHDWLLLGVQDYDRENCPLEVQNRLRAFVDNLPATKSTFKPKCAVEETDLHYRGIRDEMLYHLGSWKVPTDTNRERWVNPNNPHRARYTDIIVQCDCGAMMTRLQRDDHALLDDDNDHEPDCTTQNRLRARADLCDRRAVVLRQVARYGHDASSMHDRLGVESDHLGGFAADYGVDIQSHKEDYRERRKNTALKLLLLNPTKKVARAYGITPGYLRKIIANETQYNVSDLNEMEVA